MNGSRRITITLITILLTALISALFIRRGIQKAPKQTSLHKANASTPQPKPVDYTIKQFDLVDNVKGLSRSQIEQHKTLYAGYVKKRNEINKALQTVDRIDAGNRTYSPFRALKIAETYAVNGSILHELYFENLGKQSTIGPLMQKLITENFGSLDAFKQDFFDCGNCARGWVIAAYSIDDRRLHNFVLEEHNQNVPVLILPLLVLDLYEHAYMIDFGIQRNPYLDLFWNNINWDVIEQRIEKWVNQLKKAS